MSESAYEPELGQACFGPSWESHDAEHLAEEMHRLAEAIKRAIPDPDGDGSYGVNYSNAAFAMRRYYWGDCTCGFGDEDSDWEDANPHVDDCFHEEFLREMDKPGHDEDAVIRRLCGKHGLPYPDRYQLYCTCGVDGRYAAWRAENDHDPACGLVLPNFRHVASGLRVNWYKYIGRGMSSNRPVTEAEFTRIVDDCIASLPTPTTGVLADG